MDGEMMWGWDEVQVFCFAIRIHSLVWTWNCDRGLCLGLFCSFSNLVDFLRMGNMKHSITRVIGEMWYVNGHEPQRFDPSVLSTSFSLPWVMMRGVEIVQFLLHLLRKGDHIVE